MLKRIKGFLSSKVGKAFFVALVSALIASIGCLTCFAQESEVSMPDMTETLSSSFSTMASNIMGYIGVALPIALTIVGAIVGIKFAINFFTKISHKSGS